MVERRHGPMLPEEQMRNEKARRNAARLLQNPEQNFVRIRLISSSINTAIALNVECAAAREESEMKREKVTIYYNKTLFISTMFVSALLIVIDVIFMIGFTNGFQELVNKGAFLFFLFFFPFLLLFPVYFLYNGVNAHMVFTKDSVEYRQAFRKPEVHAYTEYAYVNKAFYLHSGFPAYYMVLSSRRLRKDEVWQINNVRVGPGMIKIRYNKKNYERLLSIVPSRIALSLQAQFKDIPPKRFNFCL